MTQITDLPSEIILQILRDVQRECGNDTFELAPLGATCRRFQDITFEIYWKWITEGEPAARKEKWEKAAYDSWKDYAKDTGRLALGLEQRRKRRKEREERAERDLQQWQLMVHSCVHGYVYCQSSAATTCRIPSPSSEVLSM